MKKDSQLIEDNFTTEEVFLIEHLMPECDAVVD